MAVATLLSARVQLHDAVHAVWLADDNVCHQDKFMVKLTVCTYLHATTQKHVM